MRAGKEGPGGGFGRHALPARGVASGRGSPGAAAVGGVTALPGRSGRAQLLGGIGVTDEQDEGLFFKRLRVLQRLFGDADWHVERFHKLERFDGEIRARAAS